MTYGQWNCIEEKLRFIAFFCSFEALGRCHSNVISPCGLSKPAFPISLTDRNRLKNLPWQFFSACVKFGGNQCRDAATLGFYRDTNTQTHTNENIYKIAVTPMLRMGWPTLLLHFQPAFSKPLFSPVVPCSQVPVLLCAFFACLHSCQPYPIFRENNRKRRGLPEYQKV